jgi:hypothetical protein
MRRESFGGAHKKGKEGEQIHSFIHSFTTSKKYFLSACYVISTVLGCGYIAQCKTEMAPPQGVYNLVERTSKKKKSGIYI